MSWNAARRALAYGYDDVIWYAEGADGWRAAGLPLQAAEPVPMPEFLPPPEARRRSAASMNLTIRISLDGIDKNLRLELIASAR